MFLFVDICKVQCLLLFLGVLTLLTSHTPLAMLGVGFIILVTVWTICVVLCIILSRWEGPTAYLGTLCILVAIIITIVLWFYPREKVIVEPDIVYDKMYIVRIGLVSALGVMLSLGIVVVCIFHIFDQHYAGPVKPWTY